jgi:hypothetical protein
MLAIWLIFSLSRSCASLAKTPLAQFSRIMHQPANARRFDEALDKIGQILKGQEASFHLEQNCPCRQNE